MSQTVIPASVVIDTKKNRIRIHRPTLRAIGDPKLIQLLVSPTKRAVAIRAVGQELPEEQTHRIVQQRLMSDYSYEIYSRQFVLRLCGIAGVPAQYVYKLTGSAWIEGAIVVFPLDTLQRFNNEI
jgi:hypothetical protein